MKAVYCNKRSRKRRSSKGIETDFQNNFFQRNRKQQRVGRTAKNIVGIISIHTHTRTRSHTVTLTFTLRYTHSHSHSYSFLFNGGMRRENNRQESLVGNTKLQRESCL